MRLAKRNLGRLVAAAKNRRDFDEHEHRRSPDGKFDNKPAAAKPPGPRPSPAPLPASSPEAAQAAGNAEAAARAIHQVRADQAWQDAAHAYAESLAGPRDAPGTPRTPKPDQRAPEPPKQPQAPEDRYEAAERTISQASTAYPIANSWGRDTFEQHQIGGEWTPERKKLHDAIITKVMKGAVRHEEKTFRILGGGGGAGKSSLIRAGYIPVEGAVIINADDIKDMLPEYREGLQKKDSKSAAFVHEESSYLSKLAMKAAADGGFDYMLDGTGDSTINSIRRRVGIPREKGYRIVADYVTVDTETALQRNIARAEKTGRMVPPSALEHAHRQVSAIFEEIVKEGLFDDVDLWDTNGETKKIAQYKEGKFEVLDQEAFDRFLAKAK